jgi:hypothetical protein
MEPFEKDELTEQELDAILPAWSAPEMPAALKARIFPKPWWRTWWQASIRIPAPLACALLALLAVAAIRSFRGGDARPAPAPRATQAIHAPAVAWRPVTELQPRIIRGGNE